jgi:hypothetical protein
MAKKKTEQEDSTNKSGSTQEATPSATLSDGKSKVLGKKLANLEAYKKSKGLDKTEYKPQEWMDLSPAFREVTGVRGIPVGHITILRGHSDSSKTTALIEAAVSAQKKNILPVFIISEMKWSWEHARMLGLEFEEIVNEKTGEVTGHEGFFIYVDRSTLRTIEDVAEFINKTLDDQEDPKSGLKFDLAFFWDSVGSLPCKMSVEKQKNNNEWNAGAMSVQFGGSINQRIVASRKLESPWTNSLVCVNKVWTQKPESIVGQPRMENKGGKTMWYDATFIITFGNISSSGINKIRVKSKGKEIVWGSRVKLQLEKNHVNGISTTGKIIVTPNGYILDNEKAIKQYQAEHMEYFVKLLGDMAGDVNSFENIIDEAEESVDVYGSEPEESID